jgi:cysteine desulfurase
MIKKQQKFNKQVYLDHASATPVDDRVFFVMKPYFIQNFANPSALHKKGVQTTKAVENAREKIADLLHAHSDEIIFTSGGTESDNLAIMGVVRNCNIKKPHIITSAIEHSAVLETCRDLEARGLAEITYVNVNEDGIVKIDEIKNALKANTVLVSIMYANNEVGTVQPIREIAKLLRHFKKINNTKFPLLHSDAAQAVNYLEMHVEKLGVDMMSITSSKLYGPKGIGILYKKRSVKIFSIIKGGDQESGMRAGTTNVPLVVGCAHALEITEKLKEKESARLKKLQNYFITELKKKIPNVKINGSLEFRLPNNVHISIPNFDSELLLLELDARGIYASTKSACKSHDPLASYVIMNMRGYKEGSSLEGEGMIRFSMGRMTTKDEITYTVNALKDILQKYSRFKK